MRRVSFISAAVVAALVVLSGQLIAQDAIEDLIVETYYVSDANDANHDDEGTTLPEGSITYRIFLDLAPGFKIKELFGTDDNPWFVRSTELIWNNSDRGVVFGSNLGDNRLDENTVALDSYITLGAGSDAHYAIPKNLDFDGSIIGGENNDGGSESVGGGLLVNVNQEIGIALTESDGLVEVEESLIPSLSSGLISDLAFVFGNEIVDSAYVSSGTVRIQPAGLISGKTDENIVLIAQITTLGELEFNFNVSLENENGDKFAFVASDAPSDTIQSPFLSFPPECGCTDPDFLEYNPAAPCDDGSCQTPIVFGCTDPDACNFDPDANFNIPELCCFGIDDCNNLDWTIICPSLTTADPSFQFDFKLYPNPALSDVWMAVTSAKEREAELSIYTLQGQLVQTERVQIRQGEQEFRIGTIHMAQGTYLVRLHDESFYKTSILVKN